jgi:hypothetical protein
MPSLMTLVPRQSCEKEQGKFDVDQRKENIDTISQSEQISPV